MADQNDGLFRELEEEMRRERIAKLWDKYGMYVVAGAALIIVGVGGYKIWESQKIAAAEAAGAKYMAALKTLTTAGKDANVVATLGPLATSGPAGYATLAKLQVAGAEAKAGKTAEALAAYEEIGRDLSIDPLFRDFGRLQAAALRLGAADWTEMQNRLNDLTSDSGAWRYSARELLGIAAFKAGKLDEARKAYEALLQDMRTPPGLAERARTMMATIVAAERSKNAPAAAPAPTTTTTTPAAADDKPAGAGDAQKK